MKKNTAKNKGYRAESLIVMIIFLVAISLWALSGLKEMIFPAPPVNYPGIESASDNPNDFPR